MNQLNETKLVHSAVATCVALSQVYFLVRDRRADESYLITRARARSASHRSRAGLRELRLASRTNLPNLDAPLKLWYTFSFACGTAMALKYLVLCSLDSKSMKPYRFLDCYLLGRMTLNGRVVGMVKYGGLCLVMFQLIWRVIMLLIRPNLSFVVVEFLLQEPSRLVAWEAERARRPARRLGDELNQIELEYSPLLDYKNPYIEPLNSFNSQQFVRMRPNRTLAAWRAISRHLLAYLLVLFVFFSLITLLVFRMAIPMSLTKAGFLLNYHHCIDWVREQPNKRDYEFIYAGIANETTRQQRPLGRAFMPLENLIELNVYQALRFLGDALETMLVFGEGLMSFTFNTALSVMTASDMRHYCRAINKQVRRSIGCLRLEAMRGEFATLTAGQRQRDLAGLLWGGGGKRREALSAGQILDVQAIVKDFFAQIDDRHSLAASFTLFGIAIWFTYSAICASWLFVPDRAAVGSSGRIEWYAIQAIATSFIFAIIGSFNGVRRESGRLYRALSTLACLDTTSHPDKLDRWLCLMRHYSPRSLACFTLFGSTQISWLLGLKALAWLASALFVASGFLGQPRA